MSAIVLSAAVALPAAALGALCVWLCSRDRQYRRSVAARRRRREQAAGNVTPLYTMSAMMRREDKRRARRLP